MNRLIMPRRRQKLQLQRRTDYGQRQTSLTGSFGIPNLTVTTTQLDTRTDSMDVWRRTWALGRRIWPMKSSFRSIAYSILNASLMVKSSGTKEEGQIRSSWVEILLSTFWGFWLESRKRPSMSSSSFQCINTLHCDTLPSYELYYIWWIFQSFILSLHLSSLGVCFLPYGSVNELPYPALNCWKVRRSLASG